MSKKVYCYYESPVGEHGLPNRMNDNYARQQASCREFAEKMGWDIVGETDVVNIASFTACANDSEKLPLFKMLPEQKDFDILLVFMFGRLVQSAEDILLIVERFTQESISVWSVMEGEIKVGGHADRLKQYISFWQN